MPVKEDLIRNKRTFYPAPKPAINREAFSNAYMTLKTAEKRLCQTSTFAQSMPMMAEPSEGQQAQSLRQGYTESQGAGRDDADEEMKGDEVRDANVEPFSPGKPAPSANSSPHALAQEEENDSITKQKAEARMKREIEERKAGNGDTQTARETKTKGMSVRHM